MSQPVTGGLPGSVPLNDYTVVYAKLNKTLAERAKMEAEIGRLLEVIESMDQIHHDIMDNGPTCTCGDADDWCGRCAQSTRLSSLARSAVNKSPFWKEPDSNSSVDQIIHQIAHNSRPLTDEGRKATENFIQKQFDRLPP